MLSATQKARRNIKLLEEADHDAINKVGEPRFKKILTEQEKQLHHYLAQYLDPNYLPKGITKEYEFPKYFYYTVNSKKNGIVQKRTRTDSAMFKRFMKNKSKKEQAKAQGIFKITDEPIKININVPSTKKKKPKNPIPSYEVEKPQYENTGDIRLQIHEILPEHYTEELIESIPSHVPIKKNITIKPRSNDVDQWLADLLEDIEAYEDPAPVQVKPDPEIERLKKKIEWGDNKINELKQNIRELKKQKQTKVNIKYIESLGSQIDRLLQDKSDIIKKIAESAKFKNSDEFRYIKEMTDDLLLKRKEMLQKIMETPKDLQNMNNPEYNKLSKKYQKINNELYELKDYFPDSWAKKNKVMGFGLRKKLKPRRKFTY